MRDLAGGTTRLAALRDGTTLPGRRGSFAASLSYSGGCVAFSSQSDDLVSGGYGPDFAHVFLRALSADCPMPPASTPVDTTRPVVRRFRVTRKSFALARGRTPPG